MSTPLAPAFEQEEDCEQVSTKELTSASPTHSKVSTRRIVIIEPSSPELDTVQESKVSTRKVVIIEPSSPELDTVQEPKLKKKRQSKAKLRRNRERSDTHHYLKENPGVVLEFFQALQHNSETLQAQAGPSSPRHVELTPNPVAQPESDVELDLDCGSDFEQNV